jgi:hypothetical protein
MVFITKLGPQVSLSPVPFFGVNSRRRHQAGTTTNVVEILLDEVAQPLQVVVLAPAVTGRRTAADFLK